MRIVLQRVKSAKVSVDSKVNGEINKGYLILLGVGKDDNEEIADKMIEKISKLRIFEDNEGKTNLSIDQCNGQVMVVSQFTLYANCKKGNRPSFVDAGSPEFAENLYNYFLNKCKNIFGDVAHGEFGADMQVELINDGPFTLILDSDMR